MISSHFYKVVESSVPLSINDGRNRRAKRKNLESLCKMKGRARKWQGKMPFHFGPASKQEMQELIQPFMQQTKGRRNLLLSTCRKANKK